MKKGLKWKSLMIERVFIFNVNDEDSLSLNVYKNLEECVQERNYDLDLETSPSHTWYSHDPPLKIK